MVFACVRGRMHHLSDLLISRTLTHNCINIHTVVFFNTFLDATKVPAAYASTRCKSVSSSLYCHPGSHSYQRVSRISLSNIHYSLAHPFPFHQTVIAAHQTKLKDIKFHQLEPKETIFHHSKPETSHHHSKRKNQFFFNKRNHCQ